MKTLLSPFLIITLMCFCNNLQAQTTQNQTNNNKIKSRSELITQNMTQQLSLSPAQQQQVKEIYEQSLQDIQQVVESNNENKTVAVEQIHNIISGRNTAIQQLLTPAQSALFNAGQSK